MHTPRTHPVPHRIQTRDVRSAQRIVSCASTSPRLTGSTCTSARGCSNSAQRCELDTLLRKYPGSKLSSRSELQAQCDTIAQQLGNLRSATWRAWCRQRWAQSPGKIYKYIKNSKHSNSLQMLHHDKDLPPPTLSDRLQLAVTGWNSFWCKGKPVIPESADPIKPIQLSDVKHVLKCVNPNRALGADQWHFRELAALPDQFLARLAKFYNMVEEEGHWPPPLRQTLVALILKDGTKTELELRPIGLTPIIYRLWMCIRKNLTQDWTRKLYGPRCLSATDLAWETRTMQELTRSKGQRTGSVFLDCSKCYERVPHAVAYADAIRTGCPRTIANLVFSLYGGGGNGACLCMVPFLESAEGTLALLQGADLRSTSSALSYSLRATHMAHRSASMLMTLL